LGVKTPANILLKTQELGYYKMAGIEDLFDVPDFSLSIGKFKYRGTY